jgi:hypothetical protein
MTSRQILITFAETLFIIFAAAFVVIYIILGDRFYLLMAMMKTFAPLSVFLLLFVIASKLKKREYAKRKREQRFEIILVLTFFDKMKADAVIYGVPFLILLAAYFFKGEIWLEDIFQALVTFIILAIWNKYLFKREQ